MFHFPLFLAAEDPMTRLVIFGVIAVIWAISSIVNKLQKSRAQARPVVRSMSVIAPPPIPRNIPQPPRISSQPRAVPPTPLSVNAPAPRKLAVPSNVPTVSRAGPPPTVSAAAIARWMTPRVMQKQYILTEIFDPPPSLHEVGDEGPPGLTGP
jgi:hypothetical protein